MSESVHLRTVLKTTALTTPLKNGALKSDHVVLDFTEVSPIHEAFAPMVREAAFDISELAIVTACRPSPSGGRSYCCRWSWLRATSVAA
jgi:4,5-dihydroxyphthalate decarboxylase